MNLGLHKLNLYAFGIDLAELLMHLWGYQSSESFAMYMPSIHIGKMLVQGIADSVGTIVYII